MFWAGQPLLTVAVLAPAAVGSARRPRPRPPLGPPVVPWGPLREQALMTRCHMAGHVATMGAMTWFRRPPPCYFLGFLDVTCPIVARARCQDIGSRYHSRPVVRTGLEVRRFDFKPARVLVRPRNIRFEPVRIAPVRRFDTSGVRGTLLEKKLENRSKINFLTLLGSGGHFSKKV